MKGLVVNLPHLLSGIIFFILNTNRKCHEVRVKVLSGIFKKEKTDLDRQKIRKPFFRSRINTRKKKLRYK